jgi:folate-binding protein YgfZ
MVDDEYEALTEKVALLDDSDRRIVAVTGDRAPAMINGLVTNSVDPIAAGRCVYAFMLTAKGRPVAEMRIAPCPAKGKGDSGIWTGDVWLDTPAACGDALLAHLTRYMPPLYARFEELDRARLGLVGPLATTALERSIDAAGWRLAGPGLSALGELQAAGLLTRDGGSGEQPGDEPPILLVRREEIEGPGFDLYAAGSSVAALTATLQEAVTALGGSSATRKTWDVVRVERGVPVYGREITPDNLPHETEQTERAIHFDKGCYTGQEVVARIHYRGHVNRQLRGFVTIDPEAPLEQDSELFSEDRAVAETRTAVLSPRFGPIALGYARREIEPGQTLARGPGASQDVQVVALPFTIT